MFKQKNIRLICFMSIFIMALSYMLAACDNQNKNCNHAGGNATCTQQAICEICNQPYGELAPHTYADQYTCHDRKCINKDCFHIEYATTEHTLEKYACIYCKTSIGCSLEILQRDYETLIVEKVKNFGYGEANYSVVILNQDETLKNLENYYFSEQLDKTKITRGLFVKVEPFNGKTMYYNFGLELSVEQKEDILVSTGKPEDLWFDEWYLEVVDGNKKLLFEFLE